MPNHLIRKSQLGGRQPVRNAPLAALTGKSGMQSIYQSLPGLLQTAVCGFIQLDLQSLTPGEGQEGTLLICTLSDSLIDRSSQIN